MKISLETLLEENSGGKLLFLGRESLFTHKEAQRFLKKYAITLTTKLEEGVAGAVEHHRLNPVEEDISCEAYDQGIPLYKLEEFERLISHTLIDDQVLMGLKLSQDQKRLHTLISNTHISDALFIKLLEMYQWSNDEEDNNKDREVVTATLRRFLEIKPNEEDLLFSPLTLKRLIGKSNDPALLYALLSFPDYHFRQKGKQWVTLRESIATSHFIDERVIQKLLRFRDDKVDFYLAANPSVSLPLLLDLFGRNREEISEALASNVAINNELFVKLLEKKDGARQVLLAYQPIDMQRFEMIEAEQIPEEDYLFLAQNREMESAIIPLLIEKNNLQLLQILTENSTLPKEMLVKLYQKEEPKLYPCLAANPTVPSAVLEKLYQDNKEQKALLRALAGNTSTPEPILRKLFELDIFEINERLAANEMLPLDLLEILQVDTRLRNALTENKTLQIMTRGL